MRNDEVDEFNFYAVHAIVRFGPGTDQIKRYDQFLLVLRDHLPDDAPDERQYPEDLTVLYPMPDREGDLESRKAEWMNSNWGCSRIGMAGMSRHPRPGVVDLYFQSDGRCIQLFEQIARDYHAEIEYKVTSHRDDVHGVGWITPTNCFRIEENAKRTSRLTHTWRNSFWREPRFFSHEITADLREELLEMVDASGVPKIFGQPEDESLELL